MEECRLESRSPQFRSLMQERVLAHTASGIALVESESPIQALIVPGNGPCVEFCRILHRKSNRTVKLFPIRSPTVPKGQERVRVVVHAFNTLDEVEYLVSLVLSCLQDMGHCNSKISSSSSNNNKIIIAAKTMSRL